MKLMRWNQITIDSLVSARGEMRAWSTGVEWGSRSKELFQFIFNIWLSVRNTPAEGRINRSVHASEGLPFLGVSRLTMRLKYDRFDWDGIIIWFGSCPGLMWFWMVHSSELICSLIEWVAECGKLIFEIKFCSGRVGHLNCMFIF